MYCPNISVTFDKVFFLAYPGSLAERMEAKLIGDFGSVHGVLHKS